MKKLLPLLLIVIVTEGAAQSRIGTKSPDLRFSRVLNFDAESATLSDFDSKVVILDFWATWCSPCIASFPHLEDLQNKFADDLQIITITSDPEERILKFLEKRTMTLPVVIDEKNELADHFPHRVIPHTVVIDKAGIVRAITSSSEIDEEIVRSVIANRAIVLPEKTEILDFDNSKPLSGNENLTYQVVVRPYLRGVSSRSNSTGGKGVYANRRIMAINQRAKALFEIAYQFSYLQTVVEIRDEKDFDWNNPICFDLIVPEEIGDQRFKIMQQQLDILYDYKANVEERVRNVKVLRIIPGEKRPLQASNTGEKIVFYMGGKFSMKHAEFKTVADFLGIWFNKHVVDQTGLTGLYDLELTWYEESPERTLADMKKLGLELIDAALPVPVLVISDK